MFSAAARASRRSSLAAVSCSFCEFVYEWMVSAIPVDSRNGRGAFRDGREAVRRARSVRDHVVTGRIVRLLIDAKDDREVLLFRRRGDDDFFDAVFAMARPPSWRP